MKKIITTITILLIFTFFGKAQTGSVLFQVSGIKTKKGGEITAGIFTKDNFPKVGQQFKGKEKIVSADYMEITLDAVPVGKYGAVVFQDTNRNKELETNFIGFPTEPIGFANGATIKFGPPAFEDATVQVSENRQTIIKIKLK